MINRKSIVAKRNNWLRKPRKLSFETMEGRVVCAAGGVADVPVLAAAALAPAVGAPHDTQPGDVILESQWQDAIGDKHTHLAIVVPIGRTIGNTYTFEARITEHNDPGARFVEFRSNNGRAGGRLFRTTSQPNWQQDPADPGVRTAVIRFTVRLPNGTQTLSFAVNIKPSNGPEYFTEVEANVAVNTAPGRISSGVNTNWVKNYYDWRSSSWDGGYDREILRATPTSPVSGIKTFTFERQGNLQARVISLDKGHHINAIGSWLDQQASVGQVLFSGRDSSKTRSVTIDTRTLENGWHSIASTMRPGGDNAAVNKIWFLVQNA